MTDLERIDPDGEDTAAGGDGLVDGRVARRRRNIDAVLDVVLEMFAEEALFPSMEQVSARSGLSVRSLYRYFVDPGELLEAAIKRSREVGDHAWRLRAIGQGPLEDRIEDFVAMRLRLHDTVGGMYRATVANAARLPRIRDELGRTRTELSDQFAAQFAPELGDRRAHERDAVFSAGDLLTQLDSVDYLRRHRRLSVAETQEVLARALFALLT